MKGRISKKDKIIGVLLYILLYIGFALVIMVAIAMIVGVIWANIKYANVPVGDIPLWVAWLILR